MSRKNLSRTIIEGGRSYANCWFRRESNRSERATTREWLDRIEVDLDLVDDTAPPPRKAVGKWFHDKLGPAKRWLASQANRPWDKVYSELCEQFDTRTVAGRHVVHDHMLAWVTRHEPHEPRWYSRFELVIDEHGILRKGEWFEKTFKKLEQEAQSWTQGRKAASTYRGWWWFRRQATGKPCVDVRTCRRTHYDACGKSHGFNGYFAPPYYHAVRFTGTGALTRGDLRRLERLHPHLRDGIVIESPI